MPRAKGKYFDQEKNLILTDTPQSEIVVRAALPAVM
jgi:hypothetical protein